MMGGQGWQARPLPVAPNGLPLANFGDRLLAFLIDTAIFIAVYVVIFVPLMIGWVMLIVSETESGGTPGVGLILGFYAIFFGLLMLLSIGATYLYYVEFQLRKGGQTVGKRVMKLRVIPVDPAGALDRMTLVKRWGIQHAAAAFVPMFSYVDGLWQLWDKPLQQCLHDKVAATVVVKVG
jgi:uncharacterized RDD family membrane protein YckC